MSRHARSLMSLRIPLKLLGRVFSNKLTPSTAEARKHMVIESASRKSLVASQEFAESVATVFHFPSIFHLRNLKNVEKVAISCVFEVDC